MYSWKNLKKQTLFGGFPENTINNKTVEANSYEHRRYICIVFCHPEMTQMMILLLLLQTPEQRPVRNGCYPGYITR